MLKAFAALEPAKQEELHNDLHALIVRMNRSGDGTMVVPSEYLEVVITKQVKPSRSSRDVASGTISHGPAGVASRLRNRGIFR